MLTSASGVAEAVSITTRSNCERSVSIIRRIAVVPRSSAGWAGTFPAGRMVTWCSSSVTSASSSVACPVSTSHSPGPSGSPNSRCIWGRRRSASTMQIRRCHSWAIASPRLPTVSVLPSPRPGLVIITTFTGATGSAYRIRVRSARYCSATALSVDKAVISRASRCAPDTSRAAFSDWPAGAAVTGEPCACIAGDAIGAAAGACATGGGATSMGSGAESMATSGRTRRTAPSRSAFSRMFWMRVTSGVLSALDRLDARHFAEDGHLEFVAQVAHVVDGAVQIFAAECCTGAKADAGGERDEHHAPGHRLDRFGRQVRSVKHRELLAALVAFDVFGDAGGAQLRRELGVLLPFQVVVALHRGQLLLDARR